MLAIALTQSGDLDERLALAFDMYDYHNTGMSKWYRDSKDCQVSACSSWYEWTGQSHCGKFLSTIEVDKEHVLWIGYVWSNWRNWS